MPKSKYEVISPLLHDGKHYEPGKSVELEDQAAEPLIEAKAVKAPEKAAEKK